MPVEEVGLLLVVALLGALTSVAVYRFVVAESRCRIAAVESVDS